VTVALIDGDIVAYRAAASCKEQDSSEIACIRAESTLKQILNGANAPDYWLFLSGSSNFRYDLYPAYKANRKDKPRPVHLQTVREFLVLEWQADVTHGYEADDALGIKNAELTALNLKPIICTIDKDLRQIAGTHYNWVKEEIDVVDTHQALVNFYSQLLLGDRSDNVPGMDGIARIKPTKEIKKRIDHLRTCKTELEMYNEVVREYTDDLNRNANLLYVWRKENDEWHPPK
jgi:5'-3' exonuclease